ncbi:hypothetical protein BCR33DRAFT_781686 [Rhizoclosmatium globosum]|uniref:Zn(2)-C6 fungal-type domain-containing protein n=1 Tax=Rhizoclosmatium globosum TaxID=329046 RepID=A0A1Y2CRF0_9FUNG|nr:hypothetical protein BCR33DRAFT_781686 [Rhizoclosmatium globosum]|eukprot:ORY49414.1 hypothetical protein BCR33DRAFT_781686 [Rhizoclosmatium globosum]
MKVKRTSCEECRIKKKGCTKEKTGCTGCKVKGITCVYIDTCTSSTEQRKQPASPAEPAFEWFDHSPKSTESQPLLHWPDSPFHNLCLDLQALQTLQTSSFLDTLNTYQQTADNTALLQHWLCVPFEKYPLLPPAVMKEEFLCTNTP